MDSKVEVEGVKCEPTIVTNNALTSTCGKGQRPQDLKGQGIKLDMDAEAMTSACKKGQDRICTSEDVRSHSIKHDIVPGSAMTSAEKGQDMRLDQHIREGPGHQPGVAALRGGTAPKELKGISATRAALAEACRKHLRG